MVPSSYGKRSVGRYVVVVVVVINYLYLPGHPSCDTEGGALEIEIERKREREAALHA